VGNGFALVPLSKIALKPALLQRRASYTPSLSSTLAHKGIHAWPPWTRSSPFFAARRAAYLWKKSSLVNKCFAVVAHDTTKRLLCLLDAMRNFPVQMLRSPRLQTLILAERAVGAQTDVPFLRSCRDIGFAAVALTTKAEVMMLLLLTSQFVAHAG
jgi:hypothetical protein